MKYFKLSLVTLTILISGCGGDSTNNTPPSANEHEAKSVAEAEKNLNVYSNMEGISSNLLMDGNSKLFNKVMNQKTNTVNCSGGGTITINFSEDMKTFNYTFNNCKNDSTLMDGKMSVTNLSNNTEKLIFENLTVNDVGIKEHLNLTMTNKETVGESWTILDGTVTVESKCITGTYTFETIEKLVDATDGSDYTQSGIFKLNGATYTFENPYVTIKVGSKEETIKQSELEKRMTNACTI